MAAPHCRSHQDKVKSPQKGIYAASSSPHGHEVTDYTPSPDIGSQRPISGLYRYGQRIIGVGKNHFGCFSSPPVAIRIPVLRRRIRNVQLPQILYHFIDISTPHLSDIRKERGYTALAMQANSVCEREEDVL